MDDFLFKYKFTLIGRSFVFSHWRIVLTINRNVPYNIKQLMHRSKNIIQIIDNLE